MKRYIRSSITADDVRKLLKNNNMSGKVMTLHPYNKYDEIEDLIQIELDGKLLEFSETTPIQEVDRAISTFIHDKSMSQKQADSVPIDKYRGKDIFQEFSKDGRYYFEFDDGCYCFEHTEEALRSKIDQWVDTHSSAGFITSCSLITL